MEHNALKFASPLQKGIARGAGLDENAEGVTRLGETLTPVLNTFDHLIHPDHSYLREEKLCIGLGNLAPGVGFLTKILFRNNAQGNLSILAIIDSIVVTTDVTGQIDLYVNSTNSGTPIALSGFADGRWGTVARPSCGINGDNTSAAAPAGLQVGRWRILSATSQELLTRPLVLPFDLQTTSQNGVIAVVHSTPTTPSLHVVFRWRERTAKPGELR